MGASTAGGFPNQHVIVPSYRNLNQPQAVQPLDGRRGIPGGPILPKLPPNPFATKARSIGMALNRPPIFPKWPFDDTL